MGDESLSFGRRLVIGRMDVLDLEGIDDDLELEVEAMDTGSSRRKCCNLVRDELTIRFG